jgi:hypothetical protein
MSYVTAALEHCTAVHAREGGREAAAEPNGRLGLSLDSNTVSMVSSVMNPLLSSAIFASTDRGAVTLTNACRSPPNCTSAVLVQPKVRQLLRSYPQSQCARSGDRRSVTVLAAIAGGLYPGPLARTGAESVQAFLSASRDVHGCALH